MKQQKKDIEIRFFTEMVKEAEEYEPLSKDDYGLISSKISLYIPKYAKILEAGCGTGNFGRKLFPVKKLKKLIGCDITPLMIEKAKALNIASNYEYICGDLEDKNLFTKESFDCIICPFILHHFPSLDIVSRNLITWCKKDGVIIIIEPNRDCIVNRISKIIRNLILKFYGREYLIKNKFGTPNETDHNVSTYISNFSQQNRCHLIYSDLIKLYKISTINILVLFKGILNFVVEHISPKRFGYDCLILIFKKKL
ncbi:MAG: class I SAM-dependent methyltransferase [Candidatus Cloacimonetes bacterium]|nr:class I SAM-dependent methyltransferase [Candidatus Cloacimonadota bacterium]